MEMADEQLAGDAAKRVGAANAIGLAAQDAQRDALRRLAEEIGNAERLRGGARVAVGAPRQTANDRGLPGSPFKRQM
jgi:hypothetical protein